MAAAKKTFSGRSLRLQAMMMGAKYKINVVWDPKAVTASTNGKTITLPTLAHSGTEEDADLTEGLFDHEVGHCRFTDFDVVKKVAVDLGAVGKAIHNTIEDIYEERMMGEIYPGCKKSLRRVEEIFIKRNMYGIDKEMDPVNALNIGVYSMLRMNVLDHPSKVIFDVAHPQMIQHFGQEITEKILKIAAQTAFSRSTKDTAAITSSIIDMVKDSIKESQEKNEAEQQPGQGEPGQGELAPASSLTPSQIDALQSALNATEEEIKDISVDSNAVKVLDQNGVVDKGARGGNGAGPVHDVNVTKAVRDDEWRRASTERAQYLFAKMGTNLEALLESVKEQNEWQASSGRKMTRDMAERYSSGNFKIFRRKDEVEQINTVVSLLMDFSGSMFGSFDGSNRMSAAWDACFALGKVLHQQDVPFSITAFAGDICQLKDFDDGLNSIKSPSGNDGATMTHEGVLAAGWPLLSRSEEKKLLVVITDGVPSSSSDATISITEMIRHGVNVAVVFVNDQDTSQSSFALDLVGAGCTYASARNRAELSSAVFSAVKQSMQM